MCSNKRTIWIKVNVVFRFEVGEIRSVLRFLANLLLIFLNTNRFHCLKTEHINTLRTKILVCIFRVWGSRERLGNGFPASNGPPWGLSPALTLIWAVVVNNRSDTVDIISHSSRSSFSLHHSWQFVLTLTSLFSFALFFSLPCLQWIFGQLVASWEKWCATKSYSPAGIVSFMNGSTDSSSRRNLYNY